MAQKKSTTSANISWALPRISAHGGYKKEGFVRFPANSPCIVAARRRQCVATSKLRTSLQSDRWRTAEGPAHLQLLARGLKCGAWHKVWFVAFCKDQKALHKCGLFLGCLLPVAFADLELRLVRGVWWLLWPLHTSRQGT